jgi:hypothetical protein
MLITVDGKTFGWGADVRTLPENKDAYGPFVMGAKLELELGEAIRKEGWLPSWRLKPTERVVFLCNPTAASPWRQTLTSATSRGQFLQVVEAPAPPPAGKKGKPKAA